MKMKERGVSPVVGTILLIAITVALAAVVAALVGGLGARAKPIVTSLVVEASTGSGVLEISHDGGDTIADAFATYSNGLVGCWHFDENSGTTTGDSSGNGNDGTINGATWTTGKCGSALSFNGVNNYVEVPDNNSLHISDGITIEAWIKPTDTAQWRTIISKFVGSRKDIYFFLYSGKLGVALDGPQSSDWKPNVPISTGTWTHVSVTYDGSHLRLFKNGAEAASKGASGSLSLATNTNPLYIGKNTKWGEYFKGSIDEVRIYERALSPEEIKAHYEVGKIKWKNLEIRINGKSLGTYAGDGAGVKDVKFNGSFPSAGTKNFSVGSSLTMHFIDQTRPHSGDEITIIYKPANQKLYDKRVP